MKTTGIYQKRTRALPTVGCEADAVIPEVAEEDIVGSTAFADGSYCARAGDAQKWTFAIAHPHDEKARVRLQFARVDEKIGVVVVLFEHCEGEFNEGQVLPGCGGEKSFADAPRLQAQQLDGTWEVEREICSVDGGRVLQRDTVTREDTRVNMCLPKGVSVSIQCNDEEDVLHVEAGWLVGSVRAVLRRTYNSRRLQSVTRCMETRQN